MLKLLVSRAVSQTSFWKTSSLVRLLQQRGMATEKFQTGEKQHGQTSQPQVLTEGRARIIKQGTDVFFNEAQVTNRDLSVAVLRKFLPQLAKELTDGTVKRKFNPFHKHDRPSKSNKQGQQASSDGAGPSTAGTSAPDAANGTSAAGGGTAQQGARLLEGLAASGLRSIRYALELDGVSRIDANDLDSAVVGSMRRNIELNGPEVQAKVTPTCSDARLLMLQNPNTYDVIDLDPYGTPAHLLDSAVQSVNDGGLLAVTATDMAVLCGNSGEVCWTKYGCYPLHRSYCHEGAVRILLACLEAHANRHKRYIKPLLAVHMDFYIRVFVRVYTSAAEIKYSASKQAYVWQSQGCDSWWLQPVGQVHQKGNSTKFAPSNGPGVPEMRCPQSGAGFLMGGPVWSQPLHDQQWVAGLLQQLDAESSRYAQYARLKGLLTAVAEELPDVPLYYNVHEMCKTVRCTAPKAEQLRSALINAGYRVSGSHANPLALKTDAPPQVVWDIMRCWVKEHPVKTPDPNSYSAAILSKEIQTQADFRKAAGAVPQSVKQGVPRFVQNPAYWGPKARHGKPLKPEQQRQQQEQAAQRRQREQQQQQQPQGQGSNGQGQQQQKQQQQRPTAAASSGMQPPKQQPQKQEEAVDLDALDELYDACDDAGPPQKKPRQEAALAAAGVGDN